MTTTEIAVHTTTELVIAPEQTTFTEAQLAALAQIGVDNAPAGDIAVFFHQAKRTGLDPFAKQIYMIGRKTKDGDGYSTKYTIQTGIDGYRLNARRAAERNRDRLATEGPFWCGEDGLWRDIWTGGKTPPIAAKFVVIRNGEAFSAVCMYDEYVQTYWDKSAKKHVPNSMWIKMPANQLAKCAEAAALRRAYPDDFSGIILEDAYQVIDSEGAPVVNRVTENARGVDGLRAHVAEQEAAQDPIEAEVIEDTQPKPDGQKPMAPATRKKWNNRMFQLLTQAEVTEREDQLIVITALAGRTFNNMPEHRDGLPDDELRLVVKALNDADKAGRIAEVATAALNSYVAALADEPTADEPTDGEG